MIGGLVFYNSYRLNIVLSKNRWIKWICYISVLVLLMSNHSLGYAKVRLILTSLFTGVLILTDNVIIKVVNSIGKKSYSLFVWHQVILAFYRYFITNKYNLLFIVCYISLVFGLSEITYRYIEVGLNRLPARIVISVCIIGFLFITSGSLFVYFKAGVVRDVPELDIYVNNVHRGMHSEYNDRVYQMNRAFTEEDNIKILVCGVSFARDWVNVLLESSASQNFDIIYSYSYDESLIPKIEEADYIFIYDYIDNIPSYFFDNTDVKQIYGIGTKNFGESNGIIYKNRYKDNYFEQTIILDDFYEKDNIKRREEWGENYIDMIEMIRKEDGSIPVFTDDKKFISQDTTHLTQAGSQYYAELFDDFICLLD